MVSPFSLMCIDCTQFFQDINMGKTYQQIRFNISGGGPGGVPNFGSPPRADHLSTFFTKLWQLRGGGHDPIAPPLNMPCAQRCIKHCMSGRGGEIQIYIQGTIREHAKKVMRSRTQLHTRRDYNADSR